MSLLPDALQDDALASLQRNLVAALDARLDRLGDLGPLRREALQRLMLQALRCGRDLAQAELAEAAQRPVGQLVMQAVAMQQPFPAEDRARIHEAAARRAPADAYPQVFGTADRLYLPLQAVETPVRDLVAAALQTAGFALADYAAGRATDSAGKQVYKIGRLLARLAPELLDGFQNDAVRSQDRLLVCLSREPMDIARMSTARGWRSCMAADGIRFEDVPADVQHGTLVAYLIGPRDPELAAPLARILLKPYDGPGGARLLVPAKAYGLPNAAFTATVADIAQRLSASAPEGVYRLAPVFADGMPGGILHTERPPTVERLLDFAKAAWERDGAGRIHVRGSLDLSGMNLSVLPDMRDVTVEGGLRIIGHALTDLSGMPQRIGGGITLRAGRLTSLRGMPAEVNGDLDVAHNRLASLDGAPARVAGQFDCRNNRLTSLAGAPEAAKGIDSRGNEGLVAAAAAPMAVHAAQPQRRPQVRP